MKRRKKQNSGHTLRLVVLFCVLVSMLVASSLTLKLLALMEKSAFDGQHRFTILSKNQLISFAPDTKTMSILTVSQNNTEIISIGKILGIPIDGSVTPQKEEYYYALKDGKDVSSVLKSVLLNVNAFETSLTVIDIARLWLYARSVPSYSVTTQQISIPLDTFEPGEELSVDKISSLLFTDNKILEEKVSIQIVNGTGVLGLGNRLARLLANIGGNVVAVSTSDVPVDISTISYYGRKTYTVEKLSILLGVKPSLLEQREISDIVIVLGANELKSFPF